MTNLLDNLNNLISTISNSISRIKFPESLLEEIEINPGIRVILALVKTIIGLVSLIKALIELARKR